MGEGSDVPVLALGAGITLLGVLRALGRRGLRVYTLADEPTVVRHSRWYLEAPRAGLDTLEGVARGRLAEYLETCGLDGAVLIACSDEWSREVAGLEPPLAERYLASVSDPDTQATLVDKGRFARLLADTGTPHPRTLLPERADDLDGADDAFLQQAFLKPRDSQAFFRRFRVKAVRVRGPDELRAGLARFHDLGIPMIVQEYVPGPASHHYFVDGFFDREGRVRARLVRRRLRMYPRDFGNSSFMRSVPVAEAGGAVDAIEGLLGGLDFRGIYSAEFKKDARDGTFRLLEVNARPWWYLEFAARCGVDVAWMSYLDALGEPVPEQFHYEVGRTLVFPRYDLFACLDELREGDVSLLACLRSWVTSDRPVFVWDDPVPALREALANAGHSVARRLRGARSPLPDGQ